MIDTRSFPAAPLWTRWTHVLRGRETARRDYTVIPSAAGSTGFEGENYRLTLTGYDPRSLPGGNGNLTEERRPVDDTPAHDRVTTFTYDFRNRRTGTETHDGTRPFLAVREFDNLDQPLSQTGYHTSVANANRIARATTAWDLRRRIFASAIWGVDPATGDLTHALTTGSWFDPVGNEIARTTPGSGEVTKTRFDALDRPILTASVAPGTPPSGAPANDLTNDVVAGQSETAYDRGGNAILLTRFERLPGSTGTGPLHGPGGAEPRTRRTYLAAYADAIGRNRFTADFGTHGGAELTRPETPPAPSDTFGDKVGLLLKDGRKVPYPLAKLDAKSQELARQLAK